MYESISKNNELENEMTLDMSYFWYSDVGAGCFCSCTIDQWYCVHLDVDRHPDLLWVVSFWWPAQACFTGLVR